MSQLSLEEILEPKRTREGRERSPAEQTRGRLDETLRSEERGMAFYKKLAENPAKTDLRAAEDAFTLLLIFLRDYWGGSGGKYGSNQRLTEHLGIDFEDLLQTALEIAKGTNSGVADRTSLIAHLQAGRAPSAIIFYDLLGCNDDSSPSDITKKVEEFITVLKAHPKLIGYPQTQLIFNLKRALKEDGAKLEEEARKLGFALMPQNIHFSVNPLPSAAPAESPAESELPDADAAEPQPTPIDYAKVERLVLADKLSFLTGLLEEMGGANAHGVEAAAMAIKIDRVLKKKYGAEYALGAKLFVEAGQGDSLKIIQGVFEITNEEALVNRVNEIYNFLANEFPHLKSSENQGPATSEATPSTPAAPRRISLRPPREIVERARAELAAFIAAETEGAAPADPLSSRPSPSVIPTLDSQAFSFLRIGLVEEFNQLRIKNLEWRPDLSKAVLSKINLTYADLRGADLTDANLWKANLRGADLTGAFLFGTFLEGANLEGANLEGADLWETRLSGAIGLTAEQLAKAKNLEQTTIDPDDDAMTAMRDEALRLKEQAEESAPTDLDTGTKLERLKKFFAGLFSRSPRKAAPAAGPAEGPAEAEAEAEAPTAPAPEASAASGHHDERSHPEHREGSPVAPAGPEPGAPAATTAESAKEKNARLNREGLAILLDMTKDLKEFNDLRDADLEWEPNFEGENLSRLGLKGVNFSVTNLKGANLRDADLRGADLRGAVLSKADLRGADLRGADLKRAILHGTFLEGANLEEANLEGANLEGLFQGDDAREARELTAEQLAKACGLEKIELHADSPLKPILERALLLQAEAAREALERPAAAPAGSGEKILDRMPSNLPPNQPQSFHYVGPFTICVGSDSFIIRKVDGEQYWIAYKTGKNFGIVDKGITYKIGSDEERCGICSKDPSVAPVHATLSIENGIVTVTDLGSNNGTFLKAVSTGPSPDRTQQLNAISDGKDVQP